MLRRLLYISKAYTDQDIKQNIDDILRVSRKMNAEKSVTGLLMYHQERFMQMIEGTDTCIEQLITNIKRDKRHYDVQVLVDGPVQDREFTTWSMGFANLDGIEYYEDNEDVIDFSTLEPKFLNISAILRTFAKFPKIHAKCLTETSNVSPLWHDIKTKVY